MLTPDNPLSRARRDGRPLYYQTAPGKVAPCYLCERAGLKMVHRYPNLFINDPANSPGHPGSIYFLCIGHLPRNAVIYDPMSRRCRDKQGNYVSP
jgi:hypothetical protein